MAGTELFETGVAGDRLRLLATIAEHTQHATSILDRTGRLLWANSAFYRMYELTPGSVDGQNPNDFLRGPDTDPKHSAEIDGAVIEGRALFCEVLNYTRSRKQLWVQLAIDPIFVDDRIAGFVCVGADVTEKHVLQTMLRDSEERFRALLGSISEVVFELDSNGSFVFLNLAWERISGCTVAESLGRPLTSFLDAADQEYYLSQWEPIALARQRTSEVRFRIVRPDGEERWLDCSANLEYTPNGEFLRARGTLRDATQTVQAVREQHEAQVALRKSEERYELAVRGSTDAVWDQNMLTKELWLSERFCEMLGLDPSEAPKNVSELHAMCDPGDIEVAHLRLKEYLAGDAPAYRSEFRIRHKAGHWLWILSRGSAVFDENGFPVRMAGSLTDFTERKQFTQALKESEERFRQVAEAIQAVFWITDVADNQVLYVSPAYERVWGLSGERLLNDWSEFLTTVHPDDLPKVRKAYKTHQTDVELLYRVVGPDEQVRWVRSQMYPVKDDAGQLIRVVGIAEDITEATKNRQALEESGKLLLDTQRIAKLGSWELDLKSRTMNWSEQSFELFGRNWDDGPPSIAEYLENYVGEMQETVSEQHLSAVTGGTKVAYELTLRQEAGERFLRVIGEPIREADGSLWRLRGSVQDITESRLSELELMRTREQAIQAARLKSDFLANISHEIRTPLNGVIGMAELLMDGESTPEQRDLAATIKSSAQSLLAILSDILDYSQIEAGKLTLEPEFCDLGEIVEEVGDMFSLRAAERGLTLITEVDLMQPSCVTVDRGRVRQVLCNLVNNALKFTPDGSVCIGLKMLNAGTQAELWVSDTGIGIPEDEREVIFESFTQGDGSVTRRYGGTGLGLAIVRQLVSLMNGAVTLESSPNEGSTFRVHLQFAESGKHHSESKLLEGVDIACVGDSAVVEQAARALRAFGATTNGLKPSIAVVDSSASPDDLVALGVLKDKRGIPVLGLANALQQSDILNDDWLPIPVSRKSIKEKLLPLIGRQDKNESTPANRKRPRALLVEDNAINRRVVLNQLESWGFDVDLAENGLEGVSMAISTVYDLILMDIQMPEMDGIEAATTIREHEKKHARHTPIVAITAFSTRGNRDKCESAGMDDFMTKPLQTKEFRKKVEQWSGAAFDSGDQLDRAYLEEISGGDHEFEKELLSVYASSAPHTFEDIHKAVERNDYDSIISLAHTLKGSSKSIGATRFADACQTLEEAARDGKPDKLDVAHRHLQRAFNALVWEIEHLTK